jgi:hypothetical protein
MLRVTSFKRKKAGQTTCKCGKTYNNQCVPPRCKCGHELGGSFEPTQTVRKLSGDAKMLHNLVSVRLNKQGTNIRIFVNLTENKVKLISHINIVFVNYTSLLL